MQSFYRHYDRGIIHSRKSLSLRFSRRLVTFLITDDENDLGRSEMNEHEFKYKLIARSAIFLQPIYLMLSETKKIISESVVA